MSHVVARENVNVRAHTRTRVAKEDVKLEKGSVFLRENGETMERDW